MRLRTCMSWTRSTRKQIIAHFDDKRKLKSTKLKIAFSFMQNAAYNFYILCTQDDDPKRQILLLTAMVRNWVLCQVNKVWVSKTFIGVVCCWFTSLKVEKNCYLPTMKFKFEREISWWQMHKTNFLNDYWTNCETATRNLSGDWLRCYDLLFIPHGNFKPLIY